MNEFEGIDKDKLTLCKISLSSYRQRAIDIFNILEESYKKTLNFYNEKISLCEQEIEKLT